MITTVNKEAIINILRQLNIYDVDTSPGSDCILMLDLKIKMVDKISFFDIYLLPLKK